VEEVEEVEEGEEEEDSLSEEKLSSSSPLLPLLLLELLPEFPLLLLLLFQISATFEAEELFCLGRADGSVRAALTLSAAFFLSPRPTSLSSR
jgi:hypothetical protein